MIRLVFELHVEYPLSLPTELDEGSKDVLEQLCSTVAKFAAEMPHLNVRGVCVFNESQDTLLAGQGQYGPTG